MNTWLLSLQLGKQLFVFDKYVVTKLFCYRIWNNNMVAERNLYL